MAIDKKDRRKRKKTPGQVVITAPGRKLPREALILASMLAAVIIVLSLISYHPGDPSVFKPSPGGASETANHIGLIGAYVSSFLIGVFGLWAIWPVLALLIYAWLSLSKHKLSQKFLFTVAGVALFVFASSALLSIFWPNLAFIWPGHSGGGRFGAFLARGAVGLLGQVGCYLLLPVLVLSGLFIIAGNPWRKAAKWLGPWPLPSATGNTLENNRSPIKADNRKKHDLGLENEPAQIEPEEKEPPIIVEKKVAAAPVEQVKARPEPKSSIPKREPGGPYVLPSLGFLDDPPPQNHGGHASGLSREKLMENAKTLEDKLRDFGVDGRVLEVSGGPVITMYEYQPAPGIKISKVAGLSDDLTMAMRAISIRVVAPLPGKPAIGIEIPNPKRSLVTFKEVVESPIFQEAKSPLTLVLGVDIMGAPVVADLAKMPHLLIAGATGSGKSVGLGSMIMSILYKAGPEKVRFLMIDPKCVELTLYKDIPHLIYPVLSDPSEATLGLKWAVAEMDLRYKLLAEKGARNIDGYNEKIRAELKVWARKSRSENEDQEPPKELPFLVIIIDELADLMMVAAKEVEVYITRLAQKARASGIHLILATQRPSVDVLTGIIKANLPTRVSFQVSSKIDSRTILDQMGAEKLLGAGDMLYLPPGVAKLRRLHGTYVSDEEIKKATDFIRDWGPPDYLEDLSLPENENMDGEDSEKDEKYDEAVALVRRTQKATISHVQRHMRIGYNRAARIIEDMEREGIVGPQDGVRPRIVL